MPPEGTINFGVGQPSADLLPVGLVRQASEAFFKDAQPLELNYGVMQGDERFLSSLACFLTDEYGVATHPDSLFVTGGNSQALDFVSGVFATPGDTVFVEEPSYFLAFQIFRDHGLNIVGIPLDDDGISLPHLEEALKHHSPAFLYTIPSYQNPGGQCLPLDRRLKIIEMAKQHGFLIVADEVYQLLYYNEPPPPAFGTMIDSEHVVSLGSFSKILAPGMRLGWIQTSKNLFNKIFANGFVNSGGCINHISSHLVRKAMDMGLLANHVVSLRKTYRGRVTVMDETLDREFGDLARWNRPDGGYFFWLEFAKDVDTTTLRKKAPELETGFQSGSVFSSCGELNNCLRLSFAHYGEDEIIEGICRMRPLFG